MKKNLGLVLAVLAPICFATPSFAQKAKPSGDLSKGGVKAGQHVGEIKQLEVDIAFSGQFGQTVTDANGTTYNVWGVSFWEPKVYPVEYRGVFPLYFFDTTVGVTITVKNKGPRNIANLRLRTECYELKTDGSSGLQLAAPQDIDISVGIGETKVVNASFVAGYVEGADSGLDRLLVKVLHPNEGGGPGNPDPALIMIREAIFCPPEYQGELMEMLNSVFTQ